MLIYFCTSKTKLSLKIAQLFLQKANFHYIPQAWMSALVSWSHVPDYRYYIDGKHILSRGLVTMTFPDGTSIKNPEKGVSNRGWQT